MKNCCVCGSNEECSNVLFTGEDSVDKKICGTCARKIQVLNNMNDSSVQEVEGAWIDVNKVDRKKRKIIHS